MNLIEHLKELSTKATPGPWELYNDRDAEYDGSTYKVRGPDREPEHSDRIEVMNDCTYYNCAPGRNDAELLVALRNALPKLLHRLGALEAVVEAAKQYRGHYCQDNERICGQALDAALTALEE